MGELVPYQDRWRDIALEMLEAAGFREFWIAEAYLSFVEDAETPEEAADWIAKAHEILKDLGERP